MSNGTINADSEKRVGTILRSVRREVGLRDMFSFGLSTIWSVLFVMGVTSASVLGDMAQSVEDNSSDSETQLRDSGESEKDAGR